MSHDEKISNEISSRASLSRYISGMFYALNVSIFLVLFAVALNIFALLLKYPVNTDVIYILMFLVFLYVLAVVAILRNLRFMRLSEVQTVFYACYTNRELFETINKVEAIAGNKEQLRLLEPVDVPSSTQVRVKNLEEENEQRHGISDTALLSETALAEDWNRPEEDEAWQHLQSEP